MSVTSTPSTMRWAEISVEAGPDATDAVGNCFNEVGCGGFVVQDTKVPPTVVGYLPVDDRIEDRLLTLTTSLEALAGFGVENAGTEITIKYVQEDDWANAWKAYFKPIPIGRRLVVTPPWEEPDLSTGRMPIVVDPGMAFGTGSHPTTQLCLAALEDYVTPGITVADIGTGSGILAIAASKLGAGSVVANDIDTLAVKIAAENAEVNGVSIEFGVDLPGGQYDLVVANILADVIIGLREEIAERVKPEGVFIASGIIDTRETDVRIAVETEGFSPLETRRQGDWVALVFRRSAV
ncbi:MAG: 50S ribosomal protein L11 methyltransferase [Capsulimonas sp.]|uniref:50S ribosomal protein L11 methyltransferase n=1 Tax=Capsulimonas sp. TaxID=2494211 RepID=UPI003266969C